MALAPLRRGFCRCVNSLTRVVSLFWHSLGYYVTVRITCEMWANRPSSVKFFFCLLTFYYSLTGICNIWTHFRLGPLTLRANHAWRGVNPTWIQNQKFLLPYPPRSNGRYIWSTHQGMYRRKSAYVITNCYKTVILLTKIRQKTENTFVVKQTIVK